MRMLEELFGPPSVWWTVYACLVVGAILGAYAITDDLVGQIAFLAVAGIVIGLVAGLVRSRQRRA